jgi:hypothetical protein
MSTCSTSGWIHIPEPIEMHNRFPFVLHYLQDVGQVRLPSEWVQQHPSVNRLSQGPRVTKLLDDVPAGTGMGRQAVQLRKYCKKAKR